MKKILIIVLAVFVIAVGFIYFNNKKGIVSPVVKKEITPMEFCYYRETKANRGLYDVALLKIKIIGENNKVTGEFRNLPAEKDSKIGTFEGTVNPIDKTFKGWTADLWWNSMAEGMLAKEQLRIIFGEGTAQVGFGEMIERGDGVYVYKDESKINYSVEMSDVACSDIDDRLIVDRYIRDNIKTLTLESAVLGGAWYATSVHIDPNTKTGGMVYEDGHIQGKATFSYERNGETVKITNIVKN